MNMVNYLLVVVVVIALSSCSGGGTGEPPPTTSPSASQLISQGWQSFAAKSYQTALDKFTSAIQTAATLPDAYNGAGWSNARFNLLSDAITRFNEGQSRSATNNLEIKAGLALAYNAQKNYAQSISAGLLVVNTDAIWKFSRDTSVNAADMHLVVAADFFVVGGFSAALNEVHQLNPSFTADVTTVGGQTALAVEIERLRNVLN